jgi:hypothetical protein
MGTKTIKFKEIEKKEGIVSAHFPLSDSKEDHKTLILCPHISIKVNSIGYDWAAYRDEVIEITCSICEETFSLYTQTD